MLIKIVGFLVLAGCLLVSVLRGLGIMDGDFIIPLILLSQLFILGYLFQLLQMISKDIIIRYTSNNNKPPSMHTWN